MTFKFKTTGDEIFYARTSKSEVISRARRQLSKPVTERNLHIHGSIARGMEVNSGWSWHFVPDEWKLVEVSMEVCDGRPTHVEENIEYCVDNIGYFCPWSSNVI